jgi:predicted  nucleic acid-binding Zn-ribbon protein
LEEGADREEMLEKLTLKIEGLENKNEKLKADLETANTQLKNTQMLGSSGSKGQEALEEDVATLNEMIALLESDLKEEKEKTAAFEAEIQTNASKLNEFSKL